MQAETLNCPMCGAAASSDATRCEHCNARLATVACPSCFGLMFIGEKFCSHCGTAAQRVEMPELKSAPCPRCRLDMEAVTVGAVNLRECKRCAGLWLDVATMEKICADKERQTAILGIPVTISEPATVNLETNIRYIPCPACSKLMNRVAFASHSRVIVDVCRGHGTWFDRDELRRVVEFIRAGGLEKAREEELAILAAKKPRPEASPDLGRILSEPQNSDFGLEAGDLGRAISLIADLAFRFLRR